MPPRPRACAYRPSMTFLGACGSAVATGGMSAQRGGMGACAAQAVAVRLAAADALWSRVARAQGRGVVYSPAQSP
eukprot:642167-Prymnesium_polylepis.1